MPLIKSAINEMRKDRKKTARNRIRKERMHDSIKTVERLGKSENAAEKISAAVTAAYKAIDKAAKKNLIHKKTAARRKSKVAKVAKSVKVAVKKS